MSKKKKQTKPKSNLSNSSQNQKNNWLTNAKLHRMVLFFGCLVLYANTLLHDFTLDDAIVIYDNEFTTQGFSGIDDILKYDTFRGFFKVEGKEALVAGGRYRPLTLVAFAAVYQVFESDKTNLPLAERLNIENKPNAIPFHVFVVLLYALTCLVLYNVLLRMFSPEGKMEKAGIYAYFIAFATSMIFMTHPLHTEVVANIKGADEMATLLGSLIALNFSLKAHFDKNKLANVWAGIALFLALLAKENAVTFIFIIPLSLYFFTKANFKEIALSTVPLLVAFIAFWAIRTEVLGFMFSEPSRELMNNPFLKLVGNQYVDFTLGEKFATIFYTLGKYIQLLFAPYELTHDYYPRAVGIMTFGDWQVILSALIYVGMGVFALIRLPKKDPISYGILFYLATLSIVSNIVFPIGTTMGERFVFIPSIGFALIIAVIAFRLANRMTDAKRLKDLNQMKTVLPVLGLVVLLFSIKTILRNPVWKSNETLFLTDARKGTKSAKLRNSAGGELITQAIKPENETRKNAMLTEAVEHLTEAVRIHPGYKNAYLLMGNAHNYLKNFDASIKSYENALKLDPNYAEASGNLAITYREAGKFYGEQQGDLNKAFENLNKAYQLTPNDYEVNRLLGVAYGVSGNNPKAVEFFTKATQISPESADAWFNLGSAYYQAGNLEQATTYFTKAKAINPNIEEDRKRK